MKAARISHYEMENSRSPHASASPFVFNTLRIREELGKDPVAELLLRNLLKFSATDAGKPPVPLSADFAQQPRAIGYE